MLPRIIQKMRIAAALGLLIFCSYSEFVTAVSANSNVWHDGPINCYFCDSAAECSLKTPTINKCETDDAQSCVTIFDTTNTVVQRACIANITVEHATYCANDIERCPTCQSSGCNDATSLDQFVECWTCDSALDENCVLNPRAIATKSMCLSNCMTALYPLDSSQNAGSYHLVRSCLTDRDLDEREACLDGSDAKCIGCRDHHCNQHLLPETRLSCQHCDGDNCNAPVERVCISYTDNEQCYIYFDQDTFSAVRMGCKSELRASELQDEIKQYFLCDGDNCNTYSNLPDANLCYSCNSATDELCAVDPSKLKSRARCQTHPFTDCYTRIQSDNHTVRGCLADLPNDDFVSCQTADVNNVNCKTCTTSDCNGEIYPSDRQQCYRCNSNTDADCASAPKTSQVCPIYSAEDTCVTKLVDGVTQRGCGTELNCNGDSHSSCDSCAGHNCNTIDLSDESIGDPGIFQELPLNCYHCDGIEECGGTSLGFINKCVDNIRQTCSVAFAANGSVVARGCRDLLTEDCSNAENTCYECKSSGCNAARQQSDYISCIFCDSQTNKDCIDNVANVPRTRLCHQSCMSVLYPRTSDSTPVFEFLRTCLDDMDLDEREECAAGNDKNCKSCTTASCNTDVLGVRKSCYQCTGDDCQSPTAQTCRAVTENDQCFIAYDEQGSITELGCKSNYNHNEILELVKAKQIWLCDADNCNQLENEPQAQSCYLCNSLTDANCAIAPKEIDSTTTCKNLPYTQCYSRVLDNGHTERGCLSSLDGDVFYDCLTEFNSTECVPCVGEKCNKEIHPATRRYCQTCVSDSTNTCETSPESSQVCLKYVENEQCVTWVNEDGITTRGCSSKVICDQTDTSKCQFCDGDNCNSLNLKRKATGRSGIWQDLPLTCHSCDSETDCRTNVQPTVCTGEDYCMTVFGETGAVIKRGCSAAVEAKHGPYCDVQSDNCQNCNSNLCNNANSLSDYVDCIYCVSTSSANCVSHPELVGLTRKCNKQCMTALVPRNSSSGAFDLTRTCLDDKDTEDREICQQADSVHCSACNGIGCNTSPLPKKRLSCLSCEGDDCDAAESFECQVFKENDECFMLFSERDSDLIRLGCMSDLSQDFVTQNIQQLYFCNDGDNCNDYGNIPATHMCATCNDEGCATNPDQITTVAQCNALPNTQCYTRVASDGTTSRGCVSGLSKSDMLGCLNGTDTNCALCHDDLCNINIFPADRIRCHRCNTVDNPNCEREPQAASVCPLYKPDQQCAAKYVNGHTYRDCSDQFECDDFDKQSCRMCAEDNCNSVDLADLSIGYPGKWQGTPINCYTCIGVQCNTDGPGILQKCRGDNPQNCATVFAANGSVVHRDCTDQIYESDSGTYCDKNPNNCKWCKSNGCNLAQKLDDYIDCLHCDGADQSNCVHKIDEITRKRSCHKTCMTGLYPRTDESNPIYELSRGCLDDLEPDDREACSASSMKYCVACEGSACNVAAIPETRRKCLFCNDAENCQKPLTQSCTSFRERDSCFVLFDSTNTPVRMGCASDLKASFIQENRRQLWTCEEGDDCNEEGAFPKPTACAICNSLNDPNCAVDPQTSPAAVCDSLPHTQCTTHVDKDGLTHRNCLADVDDAWFDECISDNTTSCITCGLNNCNVDIYPANRRSCHRCDSLTNAECEDSPQAYSSICPIYDAEEACVTKVEGDRTLRGCRTDFSCDISDRDTCRHCGTDNCNSINLLAGYVGEPGMWQGLPLNCLVCVGEQCVNGGGSLKKCEDNVRQNCVTVFDAEGTVQQRGCSDDVATTQAAYCDVNSDKCQICKSNGCNDAVSLTEYIDCYFCDSAQTTECAVSFTAGATRTRKCRGRCMAALYPRSSSNDTAYETSRSCLDDMESDARDVCIAGANPLCKSCTEARCNIMDVPEERHQCYQCAGDDCEESMDPHKCQAYHPDEQCYVLYDNDNSIVRMGCRSEFESDNLIALIKEKQLKVCDGVLCNAPEALPATKTCSVCNSETDPRCATNPNMVANPQRCSTFPYTECFTQVNKAGHTERGCLSSLESDIFYACLTKNSSHLCETCLGDNCNQLDIYPANRLKCHQCTSDADPLCSSAPQSNGVCAIYDANDSCISSFANNVTKRGCSSSITCDDADDKRNCRSCKTSGCNTVDLAKVNDHGEPGRWQDIPITCYTCVGVENCQNKGDLRVCEVNPYQNCITLFNDQGNVQQRGCSDSVISGSNIAYCDTNADKCLGCNSNGCNVATSLNDYVECFICDTDASGECVHSVNTLEKTRKCYQHCATALYPRSKEEDPAYGLARACWDDMDYDDRESCADGTNNKCKACNEAKCNVVDIPEKRLSCYACNGDDCQTPITTECVQYREDDKCYIQFSEEHSIIALGCRSEFTNAAANNLVQEKQMMFCEGDNCNNFDAVPAAEQCVICNSRTDVNCAISPENVASKTSCAVVPYTQCYSRVLSSGATERGCVSNLYDDEFMGCISGTSTSCNACQGEVCNNQIYPTDRATCHICDSIANPNCEANPDSASICPSYDEAEKCVTAYRNGATYRHCASSLSCTGSSSTCSKCTGNECNTVNLAVLQDDNFGKWQDLPLRCLDCNGENCNTGSGRLETLTCENNNKQDCMTVFDSAGSVVRRGCSDAVEAEYAEYCGDHKENCYSCKSNECNSGRAVTDYEECIYCDSYKTPECLWNPQSETHKKRRCQGGCMTALYPADSNENPAYDLIRTCLNDKEKDDQSNCTNGSDEYCASCTDSSCNSVNVPTERHACYICNGDDCENPTTKLCPLYKKDDQCFIWFDSANSVSQMGCISSFRDQDLASIIKTKEVFVCKGVNCNSMDNTPAKQTCASCSSKEDTVCATNALEVGTFETCARLPNTDCYTKLAADGSTQRGCVTDLDGDEFADCILGNSINCTTCKSDGCNREIFPADRQQCYTCNSEYDELCESFPTKLSPCPIVSETESCKTALSLNTTIRGCKSLLACDENDSTTCRACFDTECNSIDLRNKVDDGYHGVWQELPLRCHTCKGEHCLNSLGPALECTRNPNQDCMTVFNENGTVAQRGCSDDVDDYKDLYCRLTPNKCFKCKSNECNIAWDIAEYVDCVFCNSENDAMCIVNPENSDFGKRTCRGDCMVASKGTEVIRSCLDDKEAMLQYECQAPETNECVSCEGNNCNNFVHPEDRLSCHICTGDACSSSIAQYCRDYTQNDFCFAKYEKGEKGQVQLLGCASGQKSSDIEEWTAQNILYSCEGKNCNDLTKVPQTELCVSCDSSKTPECAQNPQLVKVTDYCPAPNSACLTIWNSDGNTLRGCKSSLTQTEQDSCVAAGTCAVCSGEKCNTEILPANRRRCHVCNSAGDENCAETPASQIVCLLYKANDSCVSKKTNELIERGCGSQLSCNGAGEKDCITCNEDNCNTNVFKSAAAGFYSSIILTLLLPVLVAILGLSRQ